MLTKKAGTTLLLLSTLTAAVPALAGDNIASQALTGAPPTIDGQKGTGEWTGSPTLSLRGPSYPIDTDIYFRHDGNNMYVLVDAIGDVTDGHLDECLLVFDLPPNAKIAEMWKDTGLTPQTQANPGTVATAYAMGMSGGHRVYEFQIPHSNLGIRPGQSIPFYSPAIAKQPGLGYYASIPYDSEPPIRDNVYPAGMDAEGSSWNITYVSDYSTLQVGPNATIPTLNEWGLAITTLALAGLAAGRIRRRGRA